MLASLDAAAARCVRAGIPAEHVILDPGIGFGKLPEHNLAVLRALERLVRRSAFRRCSGRRANRRSASSPGAASANASSARPRRSRSPIHAGIDIVRVHDVEAQRDAVRVADAIVRGWRPDGWTERLRKRFVKAERLP